MSNDLDRRLRAALRTVDPGERFTQRVLERIANEPTRTSLPAPGPVLRWVSGALAASLVLAILSVHGWQARRTERGQDARRQLLEALQVTSDKLDMAYRLVNDQNKDYSAARTNAGPES